MTFTREVTETFHVVSCASCSARFAVNGDLYRRAVEKKQGSLYCPACGKGSIWTGDTEDQKRVKRLENILTNERASHANLRDRHEGTRNTLRSTRGVVTKLKKKAKEATP